MVKQLIVEGKIQSISDRSDQTLFKLRPPELTIRQQKAIAESVSRGFDRMFRDYYGEAPSPGQRAKVQVIDFMVTTRSVINGFPYKVTIAPGAISAHRNHKPLTHQIDASDILGQRVRDLIGNAVIPSENPQITSSRHPGIFH